jgi:hypothetical protein
VDQQLTTRPDRASGMLQQLTERLLEPALCKGTREY